MSDQTPADEPGAAFGGVRLAEEAHPTGAPGGLLERLPPADRERVRRHGAPRSFERGATLLAQGAPHDGIMIIETGLVRSFYTAPTGREITLAYWSPGNFIGGPEIFGGGTHIWSAVAAKRSTVTVLPGHGLRALARDVPDLALAIIDALVFKAKCYASLAQMTVAENIAFSLRCAGRPKRERRQAAQEMAALVGLAGREDAYPYELSGGMRQRVGLARVLAARPRVMLMDEPFSALDVQTREALQEEVLRIRDRTGCTVVFVTHSIDEAVFLGDRIFLLEDIREGRFDTFRVDLPAPRATTENRLAPGFLRLRETIYRRMRHDGRHDGRRDGAGA